AQGVTQEQFDQGRQLFTGQGGCQACHGPQAKGTQLAPDLTDDEWLNIPDPSLETIEQLIRTGVAEPKEHPAPMPPMGGANLSEEQVSALAGYVLSIAGS
ncbi:MAG: cytochrome c, partial [Gemmatimonadetes bacterium]|nr:cytochrome c [Gemmatimonadota bacterium]